ncbi:DUF3606 domain-containing protein [Sphingomonas sp. H39-1-10]|uniref:DUF3606 domain-containing protein n=1 Tax=Sphingomonas TaxID=13687 RepID=UPI0008900B43|nr:MULTISPECIES: DUF3606 domain-containing protein [Sphingomonas]MDF0489642.1 DUF3606 domain-containing protein [Sphingomonas pollutisoli]SDA30878.1 Protein of unknown function [Sphingomonas sp. NFR15]
MSHQPPVPEANTSPYPLQPPPLAALKATTPRGASPADEGSAASGGLSTTVLGIGAALGVGAVAAIGGVVFARRRAATKSSARSGDDKSKRGAADRRRVAANQPYEVSYFARKHKISTAEARDIIRKAGPDRKAANALASKRAAASVH